MSLGIISGALLFLKQKEIESLERLNLLQPSISAHMDRDGEDIFLVCLKNNKGYKYSILDICDIGQHFTLGGFEEKTIQIQRDALRAFDERHKSELAEHGCVVSDIPKFLSIRLNDLDGTVWIISYRHQFKRSKWVESSLIYLKEPDFS